MVGKVEDSDNGSHHGKFFSPRGNRLQTCPFWVYREEILTLRRSLMYVLSRILTLTLVLTLGGIAQAGVLYTPPSQAQLGAGANDLVCYIVNVSDRTREVTIEVKNADGVTENSPVTFSLDSEKSVRLGVDNDQSPSYCKFTVEGAKRHFRVSICVFDLFEGCISTASGY